MRSSSRRVSRSFSSAIATTFSSLWKGIGIVGGLAAYSITAYLVASGARFQAVDVVDAVVLFGAFDFLREARELVTVFLECAQVREPRAVRRADALAGHDDRNAGR